ncbi:MAG: calcium/sodium antiporter [Pseudomonadota bacterium]
MLAWILVALGFVILLLAGDLLVKGAVNLALRLGIPALIVSLTIVAFGTSAPELLIVLSAMGDGQPGLAMGNIIGSNTANVLLVLGVPALIAGLDTSDCNTRKSFIFMIVSTLVFIGLAFAAPFVWWHGLVLLAMLTVMLLDQARQAKAHRAGGAKCEPVDDLEDPEGADPDLPGWKIGLFLALGLIGLPFGANILVDNAVIIAREFGVTEAAIGLTLIAIGTSLPELATTVMAALRKQADVAIGNVIGSNMFNLLAIIGVASVIGPIPVAPQFLAVDLWVMLGASLLLIPFVFLKWKISRVWGFVLTALYLTYLSVVLT